MSGRLSPPSTARGRAWCRSEARDAAVSSMPEARAGSASVARPGSRGEWSSAWSGARSISVDEIMRKDARFQKFLPCPGWAEFGYPGSNPDRKQ